MVQKNMMYRIILIIKALICRLTRFGGLEFKKIDSSWEADNINTGREWAHQCCLAVHMWCILCLWFPYQLIHICYSLHTCVGWWWWVWVESHISPESWKSVHHQQCCRLSKSTNKTHVLRPRRCHKPSMAHRLWIDCWRHMLDFFLVVFSVTRTTMSWVVMIELTFPWFSDHLFFLFFYIGQWVI
jgi:hypothetical protein